MTQARAFFEAMGQPIDEPIPEVPDAADEFNLILTRAEVSALLPLIATAQQRAEIDADPWIEEQKQWWAVTRARLNEIDVSDAPLSELVVTPSELAGLTTITRKLARDGSPEATTAVGQGLAGDIRQEARQGVLRRPGRAGSVRGGRVVRHP
jgi:hypothetical protein